MFRDKRCATHHLAEALSFCHSCKKFYCEHCLTEAGDYYFCRSPDCIAAAEDEVLRKRQATRAVYAPYFCETCLDATEDPAGGKLFYSANGTGARLIGESERCPRCGSVERTSWVTISWIPLFPTDRFRVVTLGGNKLIARRVRQHAPKEV